MEIITISRCRTEPRQPQYLNGCKPRNIIGRRSTQRACDCGDILGALNVSQHLRFLVLVTQARVKLRDQFMCRFRLIRGGARQMCGSAVRDNSGPSLGIKTSQRQCARHASVTADTLFFPQYREPVLLYWVTR